MDLRISVVIPVYNAEKFVAAAVHSALQQEEVKEVVLVDDAGPDNGIEVCRRLAEQEARVCLYQHPGGENRGASASRNLGMRMAREPYIAFLDADDVFLPDRFRAERAIFRDHPDADGVYGAIAPEFSDGESRDRYQQVLGQELTTVRRTVPPQELFQGLAGWAGPDFGHFSLIALTIRRIALERMDPWMRTELNMHEDTDFLVRLAWHARLYSGSIDRPVALRRVHPANRFIRERSFASRALLARALWEWASQAGPGPEVAGRFHRRWQTLAVSAAPSKGAALGIARHHPHYLREMAFRDALFVRLAGQGTFGYRLLHKLTGRLFT